MPKTSKGKSDFMGRFSLPLLLAALILIVGGWTSHRAYSQEGRPSQVITIAGRREPGEASVSTKAMRFLPFEVPPGVTRITIHKEFDHGPDPAQRNTVDMGLFDQRGTDWGGAGFRGWQGGSPTDLVITGDAATCSPHGIPGPIQPGRWYIAQYFLKSSPTGLGYKYTVTLDFDGRSVKRFPDVPKYEQGVVRAEAGWYAGNLHAHSIHSDGGRTLDDLVARNEAAGFDFLVSTEHNTPAAHYQVAEVEKSHPKLLILFGDELTTPSGHANILGQKPGYFFDFRMDAGDGKLSEIIAEAHRQKALFMVNHPFALCTSCTWKYPEAEWQDADAIEVWNGAWTPEDRRAVSLWDGLLKRGRRIYAFGGTDYHRGEDPLSPVAWVYGKNLSHNAILEGLQKGRVFLSENPRGPKVFLKAGEKDCLPGDTISVPKKGTIPIQVHVAGGNGLRLRVIWKHGEAVKDVAGNDFVADFAIIVDTDRFSQGNSPYLSYVRVELQDSQGRVVALTNPVFLTR